jgi:hypothetical protein
MENFITNFWPLIIFAVPLLLAGLIWFVRLEGKVKANELLFEYFKEQSEKNCKETRDSIDQLFALLRDATALLNEMKGWTTGMHT